MTPPRDMHDLVDALSDRSITDEQLADLNGRLEADAASRWEYLSLMRVEAELGAIHHPLAGQAPPLPERGHSLAERAVAPRLAAALRDGDDGRVEVGGAALTYQSSPRSDGPTRRSALGSRIRFTQMMGALAASVAVTAVLSSWATRAGMEGSGPLAALFGPDAAAISGKSATVARVAATRNCRWRGSLGDLGFGADVTEGQLLELETGVAELTFDCGARLVLEGPAAFRVADSESVELFTGRVAAAIPRDVTTFSVRTPRLVVGDSGAQYGVVAGADGSDEVHVFEGAVEAKALDRRGRITSSVTLASFEAARFRNTSHRFTRFNADDDRFVRSLETRTEPGGGLLALEDFSYPPGPVAWQNGGFGWVGPWADLETAPGEIDGAAPSNGVARGSLATNDLVALGNRFIQSGNANRVRRALSTSIGGVFDAAGLVESVDGIRLIGRDGATVYISFVQRVSKTDDVFYGFELHRGDGNFNRVLCVGNGADGNGYGVSTSFRNGGRERPVRFRPLGVENDDANFFVLRIDFGVGGDDKATVYRNPASLSDEGGCVPTAELSGYFAFDRVSLGNFEGSKLHEIDEVRIGTDFRAVTRRSGSPWQREPESPDLASDRRNVWPLPLASLH